MAFRGTPNRLSADENASADVPQSTAVLPLQYDSFIALVGLARHAPQDPLSMCIPLFAHAAFSEVQFLNLMESRIQIQISTIAEGVSADALRTLQYFGDILNQHAQQMKDSTRALCKLADRCGQGPNWAKGESSMANIAVQPVSGIGARRQASENETPKAFQRSHYSDGAYTAQGLLESYEQLHARCVDLSKKCTQGINLAMNQAMIEESSKAIQQSERLKRLTLLATLFVPLSLTSSLMGMNVDLLGQNTVRFWWFFVLCVPITFLAYLFYLWDFQDVRRCWKRFWERCHEVWRSMTSGSVEKDPSHIV